MKPIKDMNQGELAAFIDSHLREKGIHIVLSGGASVAIYSNYQYVSKDLDLIARFSIDHKKVESVMKEIEFQRQGNYYYHPDTSYFVEFISGPPSVGQDRIGKINEITMETGKIRLLSPTDSVKDRIAAFYHWGDRQSLEQALLVAQSREIDLDNIKVRSIREGKENRFKEFMQRLRD